MLDMLGAILNMFIVGGSGSRSGARDLFKIVFVFFIALLIVAFAFLAYVSYTGGVKHTIADQVKDVAKAQAKEYIVNKKEEVKQKITESKVFTMMKGNKEDKANVDTTSDTNKVNTNADIQPETQKDYKPSLFDNAKFKAEQKWEEHKNKTSETVNSGT